MQTIRTYYYKRSYTKEERSYGIYIYDIEEHLKYNKTSCNISLFCCSKPFLYIYIFLTEANYFKHDAA